MRRVIIAGGRNFNDFYLLEQSVGNIFNEENVTEVEIISGTANGADKMGEMFASKYELNCVKFPADWDKYGKRAGYLRNNQMAEYANECSGMLIAFWDGKSKGTKHMIDLAETKGLEIKIIKY